MDLFHSWGVSLIVHLQTKYRDYESWFQLASSVADLHTTFLIVFPIWFHLHRNVGIKLIRVAVIGDWLNLVLKWSLRIVLWMQLCMVELLVCMSRIYVAAHFPHQVISGVVSGVLVAEIFSRVQWIYSASLKHYFSITLLLLSFAVGFYVLLKAVGVDLLWTLEKAQKWCVNPAWVHMDSTPFASFLRNMGTLFGLGLGLHSPLYTESKKSSSAPFRTGCIVASLLLLRLLDGLTFSSKNVPLFYLLSFCKSAAVPVVSIALVPGGLSKVFHGKKAEKNL